MQKKAYLIILDGFGIAPETDSNALYKANTPYIDSLFEKYPMVPLKTHGSAVGLPEFQTGGSEVGHITIGAGRSIKHLLTSINDSIEDGSFFENDVLKKLMNTAKENNRIHFLGLVSDGGIHSFQPHLYGLLKMAEKYGIENIFIHCMTDGRDVGERTAKQYLQEIEDQHIGKIATLGGRYFGMDRDNNWERTQKAYEMMTQSDIEQTDISWAEYLEEYYQSSTESDYYIPPVCFDKNGQIKSTDVVIHFNYRTDRARQLSDSFVESDFSEFETPVHINPKNYGIFGPYCESAQEIFHFSDSITSQTTGEIVAKNGGTQLRISETEKFNHVTFFYSGQTKEKFNGEERIMVASPKCKSYAQKPEVAAYEQTDALKNEMEEKDYNLIVQNYANADLVGHSGDFDAAVKSIEVLDDCLSQIVPFALEKGYNVFITADHGNSDEMITETGEPNASHTKNMVPFISLAKTQKIQHSDGTLQDIAPTVLNSLGLEIPGIMTGRVMFG